MVFQIESSAFGDGEMLPTKYTCDGLDISPPLHWNNVPEGTKSFALICDDPDAPMMTWVHWILYNIPSEKTRLQEGIPATEILEKGIVQGRNSWNKIGYGGPCPPGSKPHRYYFRLYALDTILDVKPGAKKKHILAAMSGHIRAQAELIGTYTRK